MRQEKILIVDDEEIVLETIGDDLIEAGFDVKKAKNGIEGVSQFKQETFDLVISDLRMDEMDGLGVLKEVKRLSPKTPVIIITGYPSSKVAKEALLLGASDIIMKPTGFGEIFKAIHQHIDSSR
ncbi:MAG: response regulator [Nitrospinota bacterium]|nr:response regulator [Nitrospinota bacterium]